MNTLTKKNGFTLIELLVVIAIISLLASVVISSFNGVRSKLRNVKTRAELRQIIIALELAKNSNNRYPLSASGGASWSCLKPSGTCWRGSYSALSAQGITELAPYLSTIPLIAVDAPSGCYMNNSYLYISNLSPSWGFGAGAWIIWAKEGTAAFKPGECYGYDAGSYDCNLRYCYQYIGSN